MIDKWLKAGVLEDGSLSRMTAGTPQGGVVTPPTIWLNCRLSWWLSSSASGSGHAMVRAFAARLC
jgi:hypothetical protein